MAAVNVCHVTSCSFNSFLFMLLADHVQGWNTFQAEGPERERNLQNIGQLSGHLQGLPGKAEASEANGMDTSGRPALRLFCPQQPKGLTHRLF